MVTRLPKETLINKQVCKEGNQVILLLKIRKESKSFSSEMIEELSIHRGTRASSLTKKCTTPSSRRKEVPVESWLQSKPSSWNIYYSYKSKRYTKSILWLGIISWLQLLLISYSMRPLVILRARYSSSYHRTQDEDSEGVLTLSAQSQVNARNKLYREDQISDVES